jgi:hypothetical protein
MDFSRISEELRNGAIQMYNEYEQAMEEIDSEFFVSYGGGKSLVYRESSEPNDELQPFTHNEFIHHYGNKVIYKIVSDDKAKTRFNYVKVNHYKEWLRHECRRQFNRGVKFYPGQLSKKDAMEHYNMWKGFPLKGKQGEFPKLEYHLKHVWCNDNIEHYNYLMAWFADIIQDTTEKKQVALVVKGKKGTGKSIVCEHLMVKIFGYTYIKLDKPELIVGKFNKHLQNKLFVVLEEALWAGDKMSEGTLKSIISDKQSVIEGKGENAVKAEAYFRLVFLSNEKQAVPATRDERRYFAIKVSEEYMENYEYFGALRHEIDNGGAEAFMYYLEHLDISNIVLWNVPRTEALFEDIQAKMETIERFLYDLLHEDSISSSSLMDTKLWGNKVTKAELFSYFERWERNIKFKNIYIPKHDITTQTKFVQEVNKLMRFKNIKIMTQNGYELPPRDVARKIFESNVKCKVIWMDDPSDNMVDEEFEQLSAKEEIKVKTDGEKVVELKQEVASLETQLEEVCAVNERMFSETYGG